MASLAAGVKRSFATMAMDGPGPPPPMPPGYAFASESFGFSSRSASGAHRSRASLHASDTNSTPSRQAPVSMAYASDASIVLVGMRGTGKSTLAVIASAALKRHICEAEYAFQEATRLSSSQYKKRRGPAQYQRRQAEVLRGLLRRSGKNAIIVCSWMERSVQAVLQAFSTTNPIIYVVRDAGAVRRHLKLSDDSRTKDLLDASGSFFRPCTRFEFFNVSEEPVSPPEAARLDPRRPGPAPYLALKRAERHFLKFLSLILRRGAIPFLESAFPLASIPTEQRQFTYAISIPLSRLLAADVDVEELETGADAIEIVVDAETPDGAVGHVAQRRASDISGVVGNMRRNTVIPILYHVVFPENAMASDTLRSAYLSYVYHGIRLAPEYISVDLRLAEDTLSHMLSLAGRCKVVGHFHWAGPEPPPWTDPIWALYYEKAQGLGCHIVRLTRNATDFSDNLDINHFRARAAIANQAKIPLIAYNTGPKGRNSACSNPILSSVVPYGMSGARPEEEETDGAESRTHPRPSLSALEASHALYASFVFDPMKLYVFGANVDYSLSPAMHNAALKECGIPHNYQPYSTSSIQGISDLANDTHFAGASVGLPFKVDIIAITHSLSRHARAIGAVNTLIPVRQLDEDGSIPVGALLFNSRNRAGPVRALYGENTDWVGIRACIRRGLSPANAVRPSSSGLVIGAGGMARAAVYAMLQLGVRNIVIFNRTPANAEKLVSHFTQLLASDDLALPSTDSGPQTRFHILRAKDEPWPETFRPPTMIVSCIPTHSIGSSPAPNFTLAPHWLASETGGVSIELAYKTLSTPLLEQSRREAHRGWVTMDGLDLLPEQGFAQFELFTGRRAPRRVMKEVVFKSYTDDHGRSNLAQLQPRIDSIPAQEP